MSIPSNPAPVAVPMTAVLDEVLIAEMMRRGYRKPEKDSDAPWLALKDLAKMCGRSPASLSRSITRAPDKKPPGLEIERSRQTRKIVRVRAGAEFFQWLGVPAGGGTSTALHQ